MLPRGAFPDAPILSIGRAGDYIGRSEAKVAMPYALRDGGGTQYFILGGYGNVPNDENACSVTGSPPKNT